MSAALNDLALEQGTLEWLQLRKTKITATDASIIMGVNPWKTKQQLFREKTSNDVKPLYINEAMQRGTDLEPIARSLFNLKTGLDMQPIVVVKEWAMASLDGKDEKSGYILEIKCPRVKDHDLATSGKVPEYYYPQLQHQMYVADVPFTYYFSFDGADGVIIQVKRDEEYIQKMLIEERKFYDCLISNTPPETQEDEYVKRDDFLWQQCASRWKSLTNSIKELEKEEEELKKQLVFLSGESNTKGAGISLCQITRKGNIDYARIPELIGVDLEMYRKPSITSWRIS